MVEVRMDEGIYDGWTDEESERKEKLEHDLEGKHGWI
jgi:hypothetical protein